MVRPPLFISVTNRYVSVKFTYHSVFLQFRANAVTADFSGLHNLEEMSYLTARTSTIAALFQNASYNSRALTLWRKLASCTTIGQLHMNAGVIWKHCYPIGWGRHQSSNCSSCITRRCIFGCKGFKGCVNDRGRSFITTQVKKTSSNESATPLLNGIFSKQDNRQNNPYGTTGNTSTESWHCTGKLGYWLRLVKQKRKS